MQFVEQTVTAIKPNGKVAKSFGSITEAAQWVHKNRGVSVPTARANICNASLGREMRSPELTRKTAYGYSWERN